MKTQLGEVLKSLEAKEDEEVHLANVDAPIYLMSIIGKLHAYESEEVKYIDEATYEILARIATHHITGNLDKIQADQDITESFLKFMINTSNTSDEICETYMTLLNTNNNLLKSILSTSDFSSAKTSYLLILIQNLLQTL